MKENELKSDFNICKYKLFQKYDEVPVSTLIFQITVNTVTGKCGY